MTIERKVGMGIAGQPSGGATDVAEVFSTYLYTGTAANQTITNGIDLAGEGGMVWIKPRNSATHHKLADTERGANKLLFSNDTVAESTQANTITGFNNNGFSLGVGATADFNDVNRSGKTYASWTFRKKSGFFDCLTYTGNQSIRTISHGLDSPVGMLICKRTDTGGEWYVQHKDVAPNKELALQSTNGLPSSTTNSTFNNTAATSSVFTLGSGGGTNATGGTYIAYLFADNSAEDAEDQMIKCGTYNGTGANQNIDLGWEAQWVLVKATIGTNSWAMFDTMRGMPTEGIDGSQRLKAESNVVETELGPAGGISAHSRGFTAKGGSGTYNQVGNSYIYMAIRAPMMVEPEAATDVFNTLAYTGTGVGPVAGFKTDFSMAGEVSGTDKFHLSARLTGSKTMLATNSNAEVNFTQLIWDRMDGNWDTGIANYSLWFWKRAKGYMDVVCDTRAFSYGTLNHSLGVVPELIIKKNRSRASTLWDVLPNVSPYDYRYTFYLNDTQAINGPSTSYWQTAPTDTVFGVNYSGDASSMGDTFVYYLFATLAGISKCGSYVGNGSSQTISCGFSAGSRYILIKRTDAVGDWFFWDSVRGIVAGNDPHLSLNTTAAQVTTDDSVDPDNSGFIVNQVSATNINVSSATYIFYAIA